MERSETLTFGAHLFVDNYDWSPIFQCAIETRESVRSFYFYHNDTIGL